MMRARYSWKHEIVKRGIRYPQAVYRLLEEVEDILCVEDVYGVLLIGSASRGELAILEHENGESSLFSDIEFIVVSNPGSHPNTRSQDAKLESIRSRYYPASPFFYIDYSLISLDRLQRMPRDVTTYEAKQTGIPFCGMDIRPLIPDVTIENLDLGATNELLLWGLWSLLLHVPINVVRRRSSSYEDTVFQYSLYRSMLVIPIVFLSCKGVLLPSYRERTEYIATHANQLETDAVFGAGFVELIQSALAVKLAPQIETVWGKETLYEKTLDIYIRLLRYLVGAERDGLSQVCSGLLQSDLVMERRSWRRKFYELLIGVRHIMDRRVSTVGWIVKPKRKLAVCFLLNMHYALLEHLKGHEEASRFYLDMARGYLNQVSLVALDNSGSKDSVTMWHSMRRCFMHFMVKTYRWNAKSQRHYQRVLDWTDA